MSHHYGRVDTELLRKTPQSTAREILGERRQRDPLGPREARASRPPSRHNWCQWHADFTLIRSRRATSDDLVSCSYN
ncbi:hypothetical protein QFZ32_009284 [Streptomyces canus]|uniref:Uncharacterized protein n=1 Tax=Streptomyces canus TaxID=58343 RepID=A0AAW8FWU1_9ACTN|nr:hypothetical protein [Streptomyces canus]MDQ0913492.1 hypothetical protein [Streptomyces canus]MDQ1073756.1 hypothetical protein [Streptomyces canus]